MGRAIHIAGAVVLLVLARSGLTQTKTDYHVPVVPVCEVLSEPAKYANTAVLLVARMESSVSIDRYDWFSQHGCEHHVTTRGERTWRDRIDRWSGMPPDDNVEIDDALVRAKLALVKKTTELGSHKEPHAGFENGKFKNWGTFDEPNHRRIRSRFWTVSLNKSSTYAPSRILALASPWYNHRGTLVAVPTPMPKS